MRRILPIALAALLLTPAAASAVTRGHVVPESRYPWMADLLACGGTLVAPDRVVTAAHCVVPLEGSSAIRLTLGEPFMGGTALTVRRHAIHPRFESLDLMTRYDVAVLELSAPVTGVEPLPVARLDPPVGTPATIVGHGRRRFFGLDDEATPKRYRTLERPLVAGAQKMISDAACSRYYARNRYKRDFFDPADMICSLDPRSRPSTAAGAPWTSVCMGDSGGPLVARGELVGIVSWSEWCGLRHDPAVFARVSRLREFILGEPEWAPVAVEAPGVVAEGAVLRCVPPQFEGAAEVTGAVWTVAGSGEVVRGADRLTFTGKPGRRYTCAVRARNAGGRSVTPASAPAMAG